MSTPKKVATTIMLVSSIVGATAYSVIATSELDKMYDHPIRKLAAVFKARKLAKGFDPNKASW